MFTQHLSPQLQGFTVENRMNFNALAIIKHSARLRFHSLTYLVNHMTPFVEMMPFSSFHRFGDNVLSQILVNQLVKTKNKYHKSEDYRESLCAFILSLVIRKLKKTLETSVGWAQDVSYILIVSYKWCFFDSTQYKWKGTYACRQHLLNLY